MNASFEIQRPQATMSHSGARPPDFPQARRCAVPDSVGDQALLLRLQAGDESAYEAVVRRFGGRMLAVARRLLGHEDDAQDALQEAFLSAFKSIDRFEGHSQLGTWLHRIVVNASLMKLRARKRSAFTGDSIEELLPTFERDGHRRNPRRAWSALDAAVERHETRAMVRRRIDQLPGDYRNVLLLRDIEELDTNETAELLGINPGAVKTRLHRARMALRELLERDLLQCVD